MIAKPSRSRPSIHLQVRSVRSSLPTVSNHAHKLGSSHGKSRKVPKRTSSVHSEISHQTRQSPRSDVTSSAIHSSTIHLVEDKTEENQTSIISEMPTEEDDCTRSQSTLKPIDTVSKKKDLVRDHHHQNKRRNHTNKYWRRCLLYFTPVCIVLLGAIIAGICLALLFRPKTNGVDLTTATTTTTTSSTSATTTTATTSTTTSTSTSTTSSTSRTTSTTSTTSVTTTSVTTTTSRTTRSTSTTSATTTTATTSTTDIPCSPTCGSQKVCIQGICVGFGYLSFAMTWSRPGDGDIVIQTPNNNVIYYRNKGPSSTTDQGALDRDDLSGRGPENVVWLNSTGSSPPPSGVYYVCFEPYAFSTSISTSAPVVVLLRILRSTTIVMTFQRTFTSTIRNSYDCDSGAPNLIGSYTYS